MRGREDTNFGIGTLVASSHCCPSGPLCFDGDRDEKARKLRLLAKIGALQGCRSTAPALRVAHEISRRSQGLYPLRRRWKRLRGIPPREVCRVRRSVRRQWRTWRRRDRRSGRWTEHPDRLSLSATLQGPEGHQW